MKKILKLKKKYKFFLIEDSCHALASSYNKNFLGSFGDVGVFSFYSNKNITTGEGGMLITKNRKIYNKIQLLRNHGIDKSLMSRHRGNPTYDVKFPGLNYRIDEIRSAIGIEQLNKLFSYNKKRRKIVNLYKKVFEEKKTKILIPFKKYFNQHLSYHIFPVILPKSINRNAIIKFLRLKKIQTSIHYRPIHLFSTYKSKKKVKLKKLDDIFDRIITLPLHPYLKKKDINNVVMKIDYFIKKFNN